MCYLNYTYTTTTSWRRRRRSSRTPNYEVFWAFSTEICSNNPSFFLSRSRLLCFRFLYPVIGINIVQYFKFQILQNMMLLTLLGSTRHSSLNLHSRLSMSSLVQDIVNQISPIIKIAAIQMCATSGSIQYTYYVYFIEYVSYIYTYLHTIFSIYWPFWRLHLIDWLTDGRNYAVVITIRMYSVICICTYLHTYFYICICILYTYPYIMTHIYKSHLPHIYTIILLFTLYI